MASNCGVVYLGLGKVGVQSIDFPKLQSPSGKKRRICLSVRHPFGLPKLHKNVGTQRFVSCTSSGDWQLIGTTL